MKILRNVFSIFVLVWLCAGMTEAADAPVPPPKPTVEELQQQVDYWKAAYQAAAQQRDQAQSALANQMVDIYAKAATAPKPK